MVRMSDVWDRTTQVLSGRGGTLVGIAALTIFLPGLVAKGYADYFGSDTPETVLIGGLLSIAVALIAIWGHLALIALSIDPATTRAHATALAGKRLPLAIGIALLVGIALGLLAIPFFVMLAASGFTPAAMAAMQAGGEMPPIAPGTAVVLAFYGMIVAVAFLIFFARFVLWMPVVVDERRGLGTIRRSFALTRTLTWKIIGVVLLYLVVLVVAFSAVTAVTGTIFGLILGTDAAATVRFIAQIAGGIVTTAFAVIAAVFTAQLYVATRVSFGGSSGLP